MRCHEPPISTSHYPYLLPNTNKHEKSKSERCLRARILWLRKRGAGRTSSSRAAVRQHPCSSPRTRRHIARKRWPKVMPLPILPPIACCRSHSPHQHQSLCVSHSQAVNHWWKNRGTCLARGSECHCCWQLRRQHEEQSLLQSPDSHASPRTFSSHSVHSASHN